MTTVNEGQSNVLLKDVLIADTLPGSAAGNSILNPLSSSNKQNIGASSLMVDSKNQLAVEPDKPSVTTDLLKSNHAISESSSKKSDDSLIVPDPLKSSLSGSVTSNTGLDTLSGSQSGAGVKDALTGSSKDTPLIAIKDDTLTATDSLTNNQSAKEISPDKKAGTLVEKETKPETETTKNNLVAEQKDTKTQVATNADKVTGEKPIADASKDSNKQNSIVSTTEAVATSNLPKETTSPTVTNADKLTGEKPVVTAADVSKDSNKENSTATSGDNEKKVADNTQVAAVETPKELSQTAPKSEPVADNQFTSGKFIVDSTGKVGIDFLFDGGLYKGQLAIVSLKGMEKFVPGSAEFIKEVASRALSNSVKGHVVINDLSEGARFTGNLPEGNYNEGTYLGVKTFVMTPGEEFGVMLVPNGTVQELLNNPVVGGDKRPLFSMATANPAEGFYVGQIADVTGSGKTFAMEDLRVDLGSDRDYNDLIFQVRGATGTAVNLDSVINPEKDWRKADIGKALIAYAKPYVEPKVEPAKEDGKPVANTESNSVLDVPISNAKPTVQEDVKPVANSVATKDVAVAETKVTPTEEAKTDPIANSVSPSIKDAVASEPTVTIAVETETEIVSQRVTQPAPQPAPTNLSTVEIETKTNQQQPAVFFTQKIDDKPAIYTQQVAPVTQPVAPISSNTTATNSQDKTNTISTNSAQNVSSNPPVTTPSFHSPKASQPLVGIISTGFNAKNFDIDYSRITLGKDRIANDDNPLIQSGEGSEQGTHVLGLIAATQNNSKGIDGINNEAPIWLGRASGNNSWAESLIEFVDAAKKSGQPNAVVNISFELTQVDDSGKIVSRYELTEAEENALEYARKNHIVVVVPVGNNPQTISALGKASLQFDNIITVGASSDGQVTDYSGTGKGLDILTEGGTLKTPVRSTVGEGTGLMAGTSVAAAQVTGAISQVWAANPQLNYQQVIDIIKRTATDIALPNWDAKTGAGLLNMAAAVPLAKATQPKPLPSEPTVQDVVTQLNNLAPELDKLLEQFKTESDKITTNPDSALVEPNPEDEKQASQELEALIADLQKELDDLQPQITALQQQISEQQQELQSLAQQQQALQSQPQLAVAAP